MAQHPDAGVVRGKEPHYFSYDNVYARGWDWYPSLFDRCIGRAVRCDASTSYCRLRYHPLTIDRMMRDVPTAKIIYMVRHPLERIELAYIEHVCTPGGPWLASVNDAVRRVGLIVDSSRYWETFSRFRAFGDHRLKIVWFEEYVRSTVTVFLDLSNSSGFHRCAR